VGRGGRGVEPTDSLPITMCRGFGAFSDCSREVRVVDMNCPREVRMIDILAVQLGAVCFAVWYCGSREG